MGKLIFVSYARPDAQYARRLANELREEGLNVWVDEDSLLPGKIWEDEIKKVIFECDYFIALLSDNSINRRGYVQAELNYALEIFKQIPRGDIFLIPARLNDCQIKDMRLKEIHWVDLFPSWKEGACKIIQSILPEVRLRSTPKLSLSKDEVNRVIKEMDFFSTREPENKQGKGIKHRYEVMKCSGEKLVIDHTTGLIWQQSGSSENDLSYKDALYWVEELNNKQYAGYSDWRLPTVEEAMSLMEPIRHGELYIDEIFEKKYSIWTGDTYRGLKWVVDFLKGCLTHEQLFGNPVRAVRRQ